MAKRPPDLPEIGEHVQMRYRGQRITGVLENVDTFNDWACVQWDGAVVGPTLCHLFELRRAA